VFERGGEQTIVFSSLSVTSRVEPQRNAEGEMLLHLGPVESLGPSLCDTLCTSVVSPLSVTSRIEPQRNTEERRGGMLLHLGPVESLGPSLCDTLCTSVGSPLSVTSRIEPQRDLFVKSSSDNLLCFCPPTPFSSSLTALFRFKLIHYASYCR
jgi:hypothetical protein